MTKLNFVFDFWPKNVFLKVASYNGWQTCVYSYTLLSVCNGRNAFCHVHYDICDTTRIGASAEHIGMGEKQGAVESLQIITIWQNIQEELSLTIARACFTLTEQEGEAMCVCAWIWSALFLINISDNDWGVKSLNQSCTEADLQKNTKRSYGFIH